MLKYRLYIAILFSVMLALLAGACSEQEPESTDGLEDTRWILESYGEQGELQTVLEGTEITAVFDSTDGQVHGSAGCNSYFGDYEISNKKCNYPTDNYCCEK